MSAFGNIHVLGTSEFFQIFGPPCPHLAMIYAREFTQLGLLLGRANVICYQRPAIILFVGCVTQPLVHTLEKYISQSLYVSLLIRSKGCAHPFEIGCACHSHATSQPNKDVPTINQNKMWSMRYSSMRRSKGCI